ncbi:uncharacterized protein KD926_004214 [Aspergillus affinis]|uniref:uncharacterized protein n=1 Tax=Aspergillus affinis TaxID=1070780 RepID=UPI0022FE5631|nr:uncharacterized protein KD926_004214 [Aspergillus affinis]KAI9035270.1 hypothetical protein KD926_004214 [Aspergillus affinis]
MPSSSATPSSPSVSTITPETLESDLLAHLASSTALEDLHSTLLCSLQRMGWTEKIRKLSLELLRAGRCDRFDEVVEAVVASAEGRGHALWGEGSEANSNLEGEEGIDGGEAAALRNMDVRIPSEVVEQGVRAIKEVLREVVVLEEENDFGEGKQSSNGTEKDKDKDGHKDGKEKEKGKHGSGATEKSSKGSSKSGQDGLKNGDTSPVKKTEKKPKPGKGK